MAYDPKNLSVLAYANGFTLWHYRTPDVMRVVTAPGYFNDAHEMLRNDDRIMIHAFDAVADGIVSCCGNIIGIVVLANVQRSR